MIQLQAVLVPTDFSQQSEKALKYGMAFADQFGSALHLLHVVRRPTELGFSGVRMENLTEELIKNADQEMETLHRHWEEYAFPVRKEIRVGNPMLEIIGYAREKEIDLIVMGTHGHGVVAQALMGSVAEKIVRKAPCPVLTVRHPEHEFVMP